jgi:predicted O-methyltransferase YrrM
VLERVRAVRQRLERDNGLQPIAISADECAALTGWVRREGAHRTIEVGLAYGLSTLAICEGLLANGGGHHVALDPFQSTAFHDAGLHALAEAGVADMVEHHAEESQLALPRFFAEGRTFDLAFVDGNHRFDRVFLDLVYLARLLPHAAVIVLDDHQLPAVARAANYFLTNRAWTLEALAADDPTHRWAVLRTAPAPDPHPFTHFVDF